MSSPSHSPPSTGTEGTPTSTSARSSTNGANGIGVTGSGTEKFGAVFGAGAGTETGTGTGTGGNGGSSNNNNTSLGAKFQAFRSSRTFRSAAFVWRHKRGLGLLAGAGYAGWWYMKARREAIKRDTIPQKCYLHWKIYDGAIVEAKSSASSITQILAGQSSDSVTDEPARVMTIFDVVRTLKWIQNDDKIKGIIADFSSLSLPSGSINPYSLGLAQIEELQDAMNELKRVKEERRTIRIREKKGEGFGIEDVEEIGKRIMAGVMGKVDNASGSSSSSGAAGAGEGDGKGDGEKNKEVVQKNTKKDEATATKNMDVEKVVDDDELPFRTIAFTDTFAGQNEFLLATAFDEIYVQPAGEIPLVGLSMTIPFFKKLMDWLGINWYVYARDEYKSMHTPFIAESFPEAQRQNEIELVNDLYDNFCTYVAQNRFPDEDPVKAAEKVKTLTRQGPFTAHEACKHGLISGVAYWGQVMDSVYGNEDEDDQDTANNDEQQSFKRDPDLKKFGFYHYYKVMDKAYAKNEDASTMDVGVVYLMGEIGDVGDFGTAAVVRGLREAGNDDSIGAVVLRIDSGGGGVVDSDTIWEAVRELMDRKGKVVVASFGNAAASGGYFVATHTDAIVSAPSTLTGSIGVTTGKPNVTSSLLDKIKISLESFQFGSKAHSLVDEMDDAEKERHRTRVDEMYEDFKARVCDGREISPELIPYIAGGRVMTGLRGFELSATPEMAEDLKQTFPALQLPRKTIEEIREMAEQIEIQQNGNENGHAKGKGVPSNSVSSEPAQRGAEISEDQATSPFAPPETDGVLSSTTKATNEVTTSSSPLLRNTTTVSPSDSEATLVEADSADNGPFDVFKISDEAPQSPFGRGLIDGLGGIRDAASLAIEIYLQRAVAITQLEQPELTPEEVIQEVAPNAKFAIAGSGVIMQLDDINLKTFPVEKGFLQQWRESIRRGDSVDVSTLTGYMRASLARWFFRAAMHLAAAELESTDLGGGLSDVRRHLGIATDRKAASRRWMSMDVGAMKVR